jgi:hypothetical protein
VSEVSKLTERVRGIGGPSAPREAARPQPSDETALDSIPGAGWCESGGRRSLVVEHRVPSAAKYGRRSVGDLAMALQRSGAASILSGGATVAPYLFLDLETTGLSGGAGTLVFLVGCGRFDREGSFVTRQHLLADVGDERSMLQGVVGDLADAGSLVSFNGKSFDAPVLETRYLYHRLDWRRDRLPHLDVLHSSRLFWGRDLRSNTSQMHEASTPLRSVETGECSLVALEAHVLGIRRGGDVPGFEIPSRYFQFIRSGDPRPLVGVLEHNRRDLLSLAALAGRLFELVDGGPGEARNAAEALALGLVYARSHLEKRSAAAFERALSMMGDDTRLASVANPAETQAGVAALRVTALRALACTARRAGCYDDAASRWLQLIDVPGCPPHIRREATEALAIHHEHRARDLAAAKTFALESLDLQARPAWNDAIQHRLARIQRKIDRSESWPLLAY